MAEEKGFFRRLVSGLTKTRDNIVSGMDSIFHGFSHIDEDFYEELEEVLIMGDLGVAATEDILDDLRAKVKEQHIKEPSDCRQILIDSIKEQMDVGETAYEFEERTSVVMVVGVNGVGKTTTIAKLAYRARMQGKKVLLAAADTFRAAAVEQLGIWAERTGSGFHSKGQNADPAAVAWEAMDLAIRDGYDVLFIDTAGRLHTKSNLMDELHKIREVIARKHPGAPHRSILIVDATTGQNALQQTKIFKEAAGIDELILTKLDGTAKGGVAVAVSMQYGIPITYVGLGEKMEDLRPFNGDDFAKALLEQ